VNFIIYDLEATCWLGKPPRGVNEVIEIGAYKLNAYGEVLDEFNYFVKPIINPVLSSFCTSLTSIKQSDVDRAYTFPKVIDKFQDWIEIENDFLLCAWGKFDIQLLKNDCNLHKLSSDWLQQNINLKKQYHQIKNAKKIIGLKNAVKKEGLEFVGIHHRAISDAANLSNIFIKYIDEWQY